MKQLFRYLLVLSFIYATPAFSDNSPPPENMPEAFKQWEQENAVRENAQDAGYGQLWTKTMTMLVVILLLLFVATWYLKRFGIVRPKDGAASARIQLLEKRVISPKAVVYLLSIDGHKIALSETSAGIQVLRPLAGPDAKEVTPFTPSDLKAHRDISSHKE